MSTATLTSEDDERQARVMAWTQAGVRILEDERGVPTAIEFPDGWTPEQRQEVVQAFTEAFIMAAAEIKARDGVWAPGGCPSWCENGTLHGTGTDDPGSRSHGAGWPSGDSDLLVGVIEHADGTLTDLVAEEPFVIEGPGESPDEVLAWLRRRRDTYVEAIAAVEQIIATGRLVHPHEWPHDAAMSGRDV